MFREAQLECAIALIDEDQTLEEILEHLQPAATGGHAGIETDRFALGEADHLLGSEFPDWARMFAVRSLLEATAATEC